MDDKSFEELQDEFTRDDGAGWPDWLAFVVPLYFIFAFVTGVFIHLGWLAQAARRFLE